MRRRTWLANLLSLGLVFIVAVGVHYLMPLFSGLFDNRIPTTYSETSCLTDQVTDGMENYEIAKLYRDGGATVAIKVKGKSKSSASFTSSLGSGVCIASNGYETNIIQGDSRLVASRGSYIATNHHVIDIATDSSYSDVSINIVTEEEETYSCTLVWANKNLDVAILYCDGVNLNYVTMKDIIVDCSKEERFDYQPIFTIGCPLDEEDYLNRFTAGYIGSNDTMTMYTTETVGAYEVISNVYEDVVDITAGISRGNSGGGCFDEKGKLIGLNTLGTDESLTGGNQMNGIVPVYPLMKVIDRLIENNEAGGNNRIYTLENVGLYGTDADEAEIVRTITVTHGGTSCYYLNEKYYSTNQYATYFSFDDDGYFVLKNDSSSEFSKLTAGYTITSCTDADGKLYTISDRNDMIYFLLNVNVGDQISVDIKSSYGYTQTKTIQL